MTNKFQTTSNWLALTAELSHFFCCGLPIVFSLLSLLSSIGIMASIPLGIEHLHHMMHDYEKPMIVASALIVLLGWIMHFIAQRIDCRSTGCQHEPCAPKKKKSSKILVIATVMFVVNVTAYTFLHA